MVKSTFLVSPLRHLVGWVFQRTKPPEHFWECLMVFPWGFPMGFPRIFQDFHLHFQDFPTISQDFPGFSWFFPWFFPRFSQNLPPSAPPASASTATTALATSVVCAMARRCCAHWSISTSKTCRLVPRLPRGLQWWRNHGRFQIWIS